ncbi:MAG: EamA family transporter [Acidobacteria bacterium]|nr:EamA family transporter [Acidobacteriota bacterium]
MPLAAALMYSLGVISRKSGLTLYPSVLLATWTTSMTGFLLLGFALGPRGNWSRLRSLTRAEWFYFSLSGVCSTISWFCSFTALSLGPAVVVTPLQHVTPLFTIALSLAFLREIERISPRLVIGSLVTVTGIYFVCT